MPDAADPASPLPHRSAPGATSAGPNAHGRFGSARGDGGEPAAARLQAALGRLESLVDWERRDRAPGGRREMRVDLEPVRALLERLGGPERSFRAVHIAGTKGKGSVAALVGAALANAGHRTGVYGSPHVERIHERIRVDGDPIGDEALAEALESVLEAREGALAEPSSPVHGATWFDVITAAAFVHFRAAGVAWAAVECGLGGRLDSTNALRGEVCVLTNVGLEHTAILGSTRAEIAAEKAGIFEPERSIVTGLDPDDEAGEVVAARALELGATVHWCPPAPGDSLATRNLTLARVVLECLAREVPDPPRGVSAALLGTGGAAEGQLPGRLERFDGQRVPVVLDGAHVADSLRAVLGDLGVQKGLSRPPTVVFGTGADKDATALLKVLLGRVDRVVCTSVGEGPVALPDELVALAARLGLEATAVDAPLAALSRALELAPADGWVLVTGSLHLIGAVRGALGNRTAPCSRSSPTSS